MVVAVSIVFLFLLTAFLPTNTDSLVSHPHPAADYEAAMARARLIQRGDSIATPTGRSLLRVHGHRTPRAFILFHRIALPLWVGARPEREAGRGGKRKPACGGFRAVCS